jgi:prepilin-type N-terminal cleavage/methylation domain-containing protein/prepilin-type processing-associated H-X9-DG protein
MKKGFTVVELMVSIAVMAVLAAILFPAFAETKDDAAQTTCLSNLKQIATAMLVYAQDNGGMLPPQGYENKEKAPVDGYYYGKSWFWMQMLQPYIKNMKIVYCPAISESMKPIWGHYGYNAAIAWETKSRAVSTIKNPAKCYLVMDWPNYYCASAFANKPSQGHFVPGAGSAGDDVPAGIKEPSQIEDFKIGRHKNGGPNVAFCDGHAAHLDASVLLDEAMKPGTGAWSPDSK